MLGFIGRDPLQQAVCLADSNGGFSLVPKAQRFERIGSSPSRFPFRWFESWSYFGVLWTKKADTASVIKDDSTAQLSRTRWPCHCRLCVYRLGALKPAQAERPGALTSGTL